jgi:hypothetical protein
MLLALVAAAMSSIESVLLVMAIRPPGSIVKLTSFSGSIYAACFFPTMIFGLYWRRGNGAAVIGSMLAGLVTLLVWTPLGIGPGVHEVFPAMTLATLVYLGIARVTDPCRAHAVAELFGNRVAAEVSAGARRTARDQIAPCNGRASPCAMAAELARVLDPRPHAWRVYAVDGGSPILSLAARPSAVADQRAESAIGSEPLGSAACWCPL